MSDTPSESTLGQQYADHTSLIASFLTSFTMNSSSLTLPTSKPYITQLRGIKDRDWANVSKVISLQLDDVYSMGDKYEDLAITAEANTIRYIEVASLAVDRILADEDLLPTDENNMNREDCMDILVRQRKEMLAQNSAATAAAANADGGIANDPEAHNNTNAIATADTFPSDLMRRYELRIVPRTRVNSVYSLRMIRSNSIGKLVTIKGMITRCSDVKPHCEVCTYACDRCGFEIYQEIKGKSFNPMRFCLAPGCTGTAAEETLYPQTRGSKFTKFQEIKLQELPNQVPIGHIPRSMNVHCKGDLTRICSPGDTVTIAGVFLPIKFEGFKALKAGLTADTYLDAQVITVHKKSYDDRSDVDEETNAAITRKVESVAFGDDPVGRLARSIAPEIFGHNDVKRALLLQLVGGCEKKLADGMRIRGDINICLMGDPGVAKSQLLKYISSVAPRGVYTTGKGSSGVGLTAAITKDITTGDMALEGGALVLADKGVCCIDEFDKMDENDRTAIHEVMEQQTVSIAKAGITATLNARAAVLAAANPLYGRYNRKKGLSENINLPNSLLSRFDLMFLLLDVADTDNDIALARHVTYVHKHNGTVVKPAEEAGEGGGESGGGGRRVGGGDDDEDDEDGDEKPLSPEVVREYISRARQHVPSVPPEVAPYIIEAYVNLRGQDTALLNDRSGKTSSNNDQTVMTARQLLSILRLSQALARLRFSDFVATEDVDEAIRITHSSKSSLLDELGDKAGGAGREDVMSRIFGVIKDYSNSSKSASVEYGHVEAMVLRRGFSAEQLKACLEEYGQLNILQLNDAGTRIDFLMT
jgi:DNA replication licensing factor MCM7